MRQAHEDQQRSWDEEARRFAQEVADDPEGPFEEYNAASRALQAVAGELPHGEVKARLRELNRAHGLAFPEAQLELISRRLQDESYYRRHPLRAAWWLVRHSRPSTLARRWRELRTGRITFAG